VPGVKEAEGRRIIVIRARRGVESWQNLKLVGFSDSENNINHLNPIEGTNSPLKTKLLSARIW